MADLDPSILFNVKGLVAVVTGGGTGKEEFFPICRVVDYE